jgi:cell wall-associated NlpC family hydrolase
VRQRGTATFALLTLLALPSVGCAQQGASTSAPGKRPSAAQNPAASARHNGSAQSTGALPRGHPQVIEPVAGAVDPPGAALSPPTQMSVGPAVSGPDGALAQPVSDTQVRQELAQSGMSASPNQATLTPAGLAVAPIDAPTAVQEVIAAGNQIARLPYRYGGGHVTYEDTAYDCSGSISFVFEAAHLLGKPVVSGQLENWGKPGPGKWITVFANAGHTFMYVAGLRFDTVALAETGSRWSDRSANEPDLSTFAIRHPPGL